MIFQYGSNCNWSCGKGRLVKPYWNCHFSHLIFGSFPWIVKWKVEFQFCWSRGAEGPSQHLDLINHSSLKILNLPLQTFKLLLFHKILVFYRIYHKSEIIQGGRGQWKIKLNQNPFLYPYVYNLNFQTWEKGQNCRQLRNPCVPGR